MKTISPLSNEQLQVVLTGKFGDGCLATNSRAKTHSDIQYVYYYMTSSTQLEYLLFKKELLGNLCRKDVICDVNKGYKNNLIFKLATVGHPQITEIAKESIEKSILKLDELGLALWFYDDGSLHKKKEFYNLNTQAFTKEENEDIIVPFLKDKFDIKATPTIERKKDGRIYWYLRIKRYEGAFIVSEILNRYSVPCFDYKQIPQETVQKWNFLTEELCRAGITPLSLHPKTLGAMLKKY